MESRLDKKSKVKDFSRKLKDFCRKTLIVAGIITAAPLLAKCGDQYEITYNYQCPDASEQKDTSTKVLNDAGKEDVRECTPNLSPPTCDLAIPIAEGVVSPSKPLLFGDFVLNLEGVKEDRRGEKIYYNISDSCGTVIIRDWIDLKFEDPNAKSYYINGALYTLTAKAAYKPIEENETPWAKFSVNVSCEIICQDKRVKNTINTGETLQLDDNVKVRLEDITAGEMKYALVTLMIGEDVKQKFIIEEGKKANALPYPYTIGVTRIAPGYTFAQKWAEIEIAEICGLYR